MVKGIFMRTTVSAQMEITLIDYQGGNNGVIKRRQLKPTPLAMAHSMNHRHSTGNRRKNQNRNVNWHY